MATLTCPTSSSLSNLLRKPLFSNPSKCLLSHLSPPIAHFSKPLKTLNPHLQTLTTPLRTSNTPIISDHAAAATSSSDLPSLKARLKNGETLYGLFLLSFSPTLAEIAGHAGYDFVLVDMEHGHGGVSTALPCLHALAATRTPAVLRLPESCPTWAKKALDLGPQGIMFPMIDGPKSARKAVSYCRFPPNGVRGSAHTVVRASKYGIDEGYLSNFEDELLIMCQVECEDGVKKIEDIAAVDGVDCIQMGPLDLSASMGYLWDPGHKKVREVMRTAEKAVLGSGRGGAYLGGFAMPHDSPEDLRVRGYHMVSGAVDVGLFRSAAVEDVKKFKMSLMEGTDDEREDNKEREEKYWSE
uniref:HpcH/HpaI aldolase/citrate lyase domain-containing protein n=1 Tax=Davidia involucrata TaxID=16924 RepID=A0A5B7BJ46_DAVIN